MTPQNALSVFTEQGLALMTLTAAQGIEAALSFYADVRADGCSIDEDGDMLLFQWGTDKSGLYLDITRQFMPSDDREDGGIWQLSLTFQYSPQTASFDSGNEWCYTPDDLDEFTGFIHANSAYLALSDTKPDMTTLTYEDAE